MSLPDDTALISPKDRIHNLGTETRFKFLVVLFDKESADNLQSYKVQLTVLGCSVAQMVLNWLAQRKVGPSSNPAWPTEPPAMKVYGDGSWRML